MPNLTSASQLRTVFDETETIAVLGAHPDPQKPAHFVPEYLYQQGYRVLPVNPKYAGETLWGETPRRTLTDLEGPIDVVDVFRRAEHLPEHADEILALDPLPKVVWLQQGIRHEEVAARLVDAGIDVVQDTCMLAAHKKLGLERPDTQ